MTDKKTTSPVYTLDQDVVVLQYGADHGPASRQIRKRATGRIKKVGRAYVDIAYRFDGDSMSTITTFRIDSGDAKHWHTYPLQFRTEEQLQAQTRRDDALAVLARHNLHSMNRHGFLVETDLSTDTLTKLAAVITEDEED